MATPNLSDDGERLSRWSLDDLRHFPVAFFSVAMGLGGLALAYQKAHEVLEIAAWPGEFLAHFTLVVFVLIAFAYFLKTARHGEEVLAEFNHPVKICFFAAISISLLLLAIAFTPIAPALAEAFWYTGALLHLILTLHTVRFWTDHDCDIQHLSPAWFIPIVGNVVAPVAGVYYAPHPDVNAFFFAVGLFFWVVLYSVIFYRMVFHQPLAQKFLPTLFILIAPPAVGCIAYVRISGQFDAVASALYSLALFFTLLITVKAKRFHKIKFFLSWWAFTFPVAAMTLATLLRYETSGGLFYELLSYALLGATTAVVAAVFALTLHHLMKGELLVQES